MKMIVGLGNPDPAYCNNRHNVGFMMIDFLAQEMGVNTFQSKFSAQYAKVNWKKHQLILLKPMTYMNLSGQAVVACSQFFKIDPPQTVVISDDLDLAQGKIRVRQSGGHGGHNGLRSIIEKLGRNDFYRIRIGIGRPNTKQSVSDYVLSNYTTEEQTILEELKPKFCEHLYHFIENH